MNKRSLILTALLLFSGCSTAFDARGIFHRVNRGETLLWIAKSYGVDLQDLAEMNGIEIANQPLKAGEKLYIPPKRLHRHKKLPFEGEIGRHIYRSTRHRGERISVTEKQRSSRKIYTDHNKFEWPVYGKISSPFGVRNGRRHDGVDIRAKMGTSIKVADAGNVVFAGKMRGYGNLILVRHRDNFFTAYAHNSRNRVKKGEKVKKGEVIGDVGRTGRATGPHLHFEVREGERARNPMFFLPVLR